MLQRLKNFQVFWYVLVLVISDQITKFYFESKTYFEDFFFYISYSQNYGSAFSMFSDISYYSLVIIILSITAIGFLIWKKNTFTKTVFMKWIYIFLLSGIIGNFIDRLLFGYVRDFIGIKYFFIFNIADVYLTLAFILFLVHEVSENKYLKS